MILGGAVVLVLTAAYFLLMAKSPGPQPEVVVVPTSLPSPIEVGPTVIPTDPAPMEGVPTPTELPKFESLRSNVCPVAFKVPAGKIYIPSKGTNGQWQVKDEKDNRFMFLPRAEETNGKRTTAELRADGQIYYNPQTNVEVYCQDNPNKWTSEQMMDFVVKADFLKSTSVAKIRKWNRDVYVLNYVPNYDDITRTNWFFATPGTLFRIEKYVGDSDFQTQNSQVFDDISFL